MGLTLLPPSTAVSGLSREEAASRLAAEGANELPSAVRRSAWAIAADLLREPMILLLVVCGGTYLLLGDSREALLLAASIVLIIGIELVQKHKTERALDALRDLSSPRALVLRNGQPRRVPSREVVRGDLVMLQEGDRVPADAIVRVGEHLLVDESLLTGESAPVRKSFNAERQDLSRPGGDDLPFVFAGTVVVGGRARAEVLATGPRTEMGKIGKSLQTITAEPTPVQRETARLVRVLAVIGISLCAAVAVLYGATRGNWLQGVLAGLTLAISLIPEELPVVLTIFLALGAWRLSRQQVLTRRIPAVEMLGSATVLCADKTGTLTLNRMSVQELRADSAVHDAAPEHDPLPEAMRELAAISILASRREPFDPTEQALHRLAARLDPQSLRPGWKPVKEYPFSKALLAVAYAWQSPAGGPCLVAVKGAPETVARLCRLSGPQADRAAEAMHAMAAKGLRVLGVARGVLEPSQPPRDLRAIPLDWLGLVGLADPVRPMVPGAIRECRQAGVRVIMMTGDYPATAGAVARQIGLTPVEAVLTGPDLDRLDDAALAERIPQVQLFARIVPEQKLRLVNALKAHGHVVAMTGDGVNDAPALKAAHIGIAMGDRGTDVAREAAALVLLDDDFSSIVRAIRMGRRVFDNLKKAVAYIIAIHVPIAGMALIPVMLGWPLVLLPAHIVFLELIIDPACSVAFEAEGEEDDVMRRPPRPPRDPLFTKRTIGVSVLQGAGVLCLVLGVFGLALRRGAGEAEARAMTFTSLVFGNLALILTNRSWSRPLFQALRRPNPALSWILGGTLAVLGLVLYVPALRELFHFAVLRADDLLICLLAGGLSVVWCEWVKRR